MRERKPYPDVSDEELDRRAEEALKRMLANPQKQPHEQQAPRKNPNNQNNQNRRQKRRPR
jgi:Mn-dependent DtxR family transcriptional regulator